MRKACGHQETTDSSSDEIHIRISNEGTSASGLGLTYYFDDVPTGSVGMKKVKGNTYAFKLMNEDGCYADMEIYWAYGD